MYNIGKPVRKINHVGRCALLFETEDTIINIYSVDVAPSFNLRYSHSFSIILLFWTFVTARVHQVTQYSTFLNQTPILEQV
jgi:hypothetical protein